MHSLATLATLTLCAASGTSFTYTVSHAFDGGDFTNRSIVTIDRSDPTFVFSSATNFTLDSQFLDSLLNSYLYRIKLSSSNSDSTTTTTTTISTVNSCSLIRGNARDTISVTLGIDDNLVASEYSVLVGKLAAKDCETLKRSKIDSPLREKFLAKVPNFRTTVDVAETKIVQTIPLSIKGGPPPGMLPVKNPHLQSVMAEHRMLNGGGSGGAGGGGAGGGIPGLNAGPDGDKAPVRKGLLQQYWYLIPVFLIMQAMGGGPEEGGGAKGEGVANKAEGGAGKERRGETAKD